MDAFGVKIKSETIAKNVLLSKQAHLARVIVRLSPITGKPKSPERHNCF